jgi:hypothetical protein
MIVYGMRLLGSRWILINVLLYQLNSFPRGMHSVPPHQGHVFLDHLWHMTLPR